MIQAFFGVAIVAILAILYWASHDTQNRDRWGGV